MKFYIELFRFIKKHQPYSVFFLLLTFTISSVLEAIGIGFVLPVIALVLEENFMQILTSSQYGKYFPDSILSLNRYDAIILFSFLVIAAYLLKNIILVFTEYLRNIFVNRIKEKLSSIIMNKYIHQDYLYHSKKNNSEISSIINTKINEVTDGVISAFLIVLSEMILILGLVFLIFFFKQTNIFLILLVLFLFGIITGRVITFYLKRLGKVRIKSVNEKYINFTNIINNFREIILTGNTGLYFINFKNSLQTIAKVEALRSALQRVPVLVFESIGILGLILIIFFLLKSDASSVKIISVCTFFAAVTYRVLPSLHKISFFYYNIKFNQPLFHDVQEEIQIKNKIEFHKKKFKIKDSIQLKNISFKYNNTAENIVENINLKININTAVGILGESGSGKTTILDLLSSLIIPSEGKIYVDDEEINNDFLRRKIQNNISYTSQKTTIINGDLIKNICFGDLYTDIDHDRFDEVIEIVGLKDIQNEFEKNLKEIADTGKNISGGQLQRIGIARALYQNKDILIFDEATNALDENLEKKIIEKIIKLKKHKTLIFVSHNIELLQRLDFIYEIKNKNIFTIK